jgi:ADP-ribose pyrophosphatase YjhB (NUDIX family)
VVDSIVRAAYRTASLALRVWARLTHPTVTGATVLVWRASALLLVQTSYQPWRSPPGGRVASGEDPRDAAARELQEETGLQIAPAVLDNLGTWIVDHSHIEDHVHVFACNEADTTGSLRVDQREIIAASFVEFDTLAGLELWPPLQALRADGLRPPLPGV